MLRHFLAISLNFLLDSLLVVFIRRADDYSLALEACEQTHLPLLARSRQVGLQRQRRGLFEQSVIKYMVVTTLSKSHIHGPGCSSSSYEQQSQ